MGLVNKHSHEWLVIRKELRTTIASLQVQLEIVGTPEDMSNFLRGQIGMCRKIISDVEGGEVIIPDDTSEPLII